MDPSQLQADLQKANETLYKQNFELSIRNQTLSALRSLYDITLSSISVQEISQKVADSMVRELGFAAVLISIVDKTKKTLTPVAINDSSQTNSAIALIHKPLDQMAIPLDFQDNLAIVALKTKTRQVTTNILDILDPIVTQEIADQIENTSGVKTVVIYPLVLAGNPVGVLNIGLAKKVDDMSRSEKETLEQLIDLVTIALDRAKLYEDVKTANEKLIALDKIKDEFVYLASHELRTPLTAIKSYAWMILNGKSEAIGATTKKYLDIVYSSTERLIHLVNEMLDLSRIESGKVQLKLEPVKLDELIMVVKAEFSARSTEKHLTLDSDTAPLTVTADKDKLMQIFENLVGNSFKFTPVGGKVIIHAKVKDKFAEISIEDNGKGIADEDLPKLFAKFGRLDNNSMTTTPESGTGLGLYITKQFVELHGGQVEVKSKVGVGTTFTFTLPLA